MPPCAQRVEPADSTSLVTSSTRSADWPRDLQRGREPGDAGTDDDDVGLGRPPAGRGRRRHRTGVIGGPR